MSAEADAPGRAAAGAETSAPDAAANNFDGLRLAFAFAVVLFHIAALTAIPALAPAQAALGLGAELAVQGFFVISGFLVYGSYERTGAVLRYFEKRARRLYPAYAAIVVLMALMSLAWFAREGGELAHVARYLGANLVFANFLAPTLPGLFPANPHPEVNGALWTIKIEVGFYLIVPLLFFLMARMQKLALVLAVYVGALVWRGAWEDGAAGGWLYGEEMARQLPGQMGFFICGVALWIWRDGARRRMPWIAGAGAVLFALSFVPGLEDVARPAGWAGLIFAAAFAVPRLYDAKKTGDYSYGLYLVHFPIIQMVVAGGFAATAPLMSCVMILAMSGAASWAMWRFVERPFLLPSSHYTR
jgi:peptidoglycan/LPS O-acetylase OafA/YrhL